MDFILQNDQIVVIIEVVLILCWIGQVGQFLIAQFRNFKCSNQVNSQTQKNHQHENKQNKQQNQSNKSNSLQAPSFFIRLSDIFLAPNFQNISSSQSSPIKPLQIKQYINILVISSSLCIIFLFSIDTYDHLIKHFLIKSFNKNQGNNREIYKSINMHQLLKLIQDLVFLYVVTMEIKWDKSYNNNKNEKRSGCNVGTFVIKQILMIVLVLINPFYMGFYLLLKVSQFVKQINCQNNHKNKLNSTKTILFKELFRLLTLFSIVGFIILQIADQQSKFGQHYRTLLFPQSYSPQTNLMWIMYAHMFTRYLFMYQLIFYLIPISLSIPLSLLSINFQTKIIVQYLTIIFVSNYSTNSNLFIFWYVVLLSLNKYAHYKKVQKKLLIINKSLGLVAFFGSGFFFLCYTKITELYLNTWMVNIGYLFFFGCLFWFLIVIWLVQLINIQLEETSQGKIQYQPTQKGLMDKIIQKIKSFFKKDQVVQSQLKSSQKS